VELARPAHGAEVGVHDDDVRAALRELDETSLVSVHGRLGLDDLVVNVRQTHLGHCVTPAEKALR